MELIFVDASGAGGVQDVACPPRGTAYIDVGRGDFRNVVRQCVPGAVLGGRKPAVRCAGVPSAGEVEQGGAALPAEFEDFLAQVELLVAVAAEQDRRLAGGKRGGLKEG